MDLWPGKEPSCPAMIKQNQVHCLVNSLKYLTLLCNVQDVFTTIHSVQTAS
jgi:hypothetical protein